MEFGVACTDDGGVDTVMTIEGGAAAATSTVTVAGNITCAGEITCTSDMELKTNINNIENPMKNLHKLMELNLTGYIIIKNHLVLLLRMLKQSYLKQLQK